MYAVVEKRRRLSRTLGDAATSTNPAAISDADANKILDQIVSTYPVNYAQWIPDKQYAKCFDPAVYAPWINYSGVIGQGKNHFDRIPANLPPNMRAGFMALLSGTCISDIEGFFGKYASDQLREANLHFVAWGLPLQAAPPGHGGWLEKHTGIFNYIAPGTSLLSNLTNHIWNSKIGDLVRKITPRFLHSSVHTGLNLAVSGFMPGTIPGASGLVADIKQQGLKQAAINTAEQAAAFAAGAAGVFSPSTYAGFGSAISAGASVLPSIGGALMKKPAQPGIAQSVTAGGATVGPVSSITPQTPQTPVYPGSKSLTASPYFVPGAILAGGVLLVLALAPKRKKRK